MLSQPKYVRKASQFVVTERDGDHNLKGCKQKQIWFPNLEEAKEFIHNSLVVN